MRAEVSSQRSEVSLPAIALAKAGGRRPEASQESTRQLLAQSRRLLLKLDNSRTVTMADHRERRLLIEAIEKLLKRNTSKLSKGA
jgi:hypothetical protein